MSCSAEMMTDQRKVSRGEGIDPFGMPHHTQNGCPAISYRFDDAVRSYCPNVERWPRLKRTPLMKAIHFDLVLPYANNLAWRYMARDPVHRDTRPLLNN